ncbi:G patch domain-containing protein 1 [Hippoglossus stenolepis]|uniref:G patch domain-containing protein 1 n=1 Tax=Hippoglossus stenolepis TaxID=195615 RepID=UPI00159C0F15|nr:G patch domain-containing protein 1 [Hippoglossus stenolepis]XP_047194332.1 G patch domain-containing protein 1 [Hippoglossus stenolepis]
MRRDDTNGSTERSPGDFQPVTSTRSAQRKKVEKQHVRPEDFMDEEDFSEHGIAPAQITTSQEFSSSHRDEAREKARAVNAQAALIPGDTLLEELIAPARSDLFTRVT